MTVEASAAEAARFRMLIVLDDPSLAELADNALASISAIGPAAERAALVPAEEQFAATVKLFVAAAARILR